MKLLINTSNAKVVEVSLHKASKTLAILSEKNEYGSQVLLSLVTKLLASQGVSLQDLSAIEVDVGPGSYTGLKVGAAVGQALAFALNIPVNGELNKPVSLEYT